jgi:hypothetical protein
MKKVREMNLIELSNEFSKRNMPNHTIKWSAKEETFYGEYPDGGGFGIDHGIEASFEDVLKAIEQNPF